MYVSSIVLSFLHMSCICCSLLYHQKLISATRKSRRISVPAFQCISVPGHTNRSAVYIPAATPARQPITLRAIYRTDILAFPCSSRLYALQRKGGKCRKSPAYARLEEQHGIVRESLSRRSTGNDTDCQRSQYICDQCKHRESAFIRIRLMAYLSIAPTAPPIPTHTNPVIILPHINDVIVFSRLCLRHCPSAGYPRIQCPTPI